MRISEMGRTRSSANSDCETYVKRNNNTGYITYKHPLMDSTESFGKGPQALKEANELARIVNAELSSQATRIKNILNGSPSRRKGSKRSPLFSDVLKEFKRERVPELKWKGGYKKTQLSRIAKFDEYGGNVLYEQTDVEFFADMVKALFAGASRRSAISLIRTIDAWAVGNGRRKGSNVAVGIMLPAKAKRKRQRIADLEEFNKIREPAEQWEKDVLDFALITLQPREVICSLDIHKHLKREFDKDQNTYRTFLRFQRGKTGVYIEIEVGEALLPLINRRRKEAIRLGTHRLFCRAPRLPKHSVNIKPDKLTRSITKLVKKSGLYEENHPTLHEVRSLGGRLMEEQGYDKQLIQDLMGHMKPSTTEIYLNTDKPKYKKSKTVLEIEV